MKHLYQTAVTVGLFLMTVCLLGCKKPEPVIEVPVEQVEPDKPGLSLKLDEVVTLTPVTVVPEPTPEPPKNLVQFLVKEKIDCASMAKALEDLMKEPLKDTGVSINFLDQLRYSYTEAGAVKIERECYLLE